MKSRYLTERLPFLLPLRLRQRKMWYYAKMRFDGNRYAANRRPLFAHTLCEQRSLLINEHTGADIAYQYNKAHNLRLAAQAISGVVVMPGETFSLWRLARHADRRERYRDGLCVHNGRLVAVYGGGLCQLSNLLFLLFLATPLTIVERHTHKVKEFPNPSPDDLCGVDATILEGWLDLRARNDTDTPLQIFLSVDEKYLSGKILTPRELSERYGVINQGLRYFEKDSQMYESVTVVRQTLDARTGALLGQTPLYTNVCKLGYDPAGVK